MPPMPADDFDRDDALDDLTSEELEEQAFGPDPNRKRRRKRRSRRSKKQAKAKADVPAPVAPRPARSVVVTKFCYACGAEVDARAEVCPRCGVRQPEAPFRLGRRSRGGDKSKGGATLLALLFGGVGGHRFYLGQWKIGLVMLAFCWTFLPALVGVVDFVRLAFMSDRRFAELYGRQPPPLLVPPRPVRRLERGPVEGEPETDPEADLDDGV